MFDQIRGKHNPGKHRLKGHRNDSSNAATSFAKLEHQTAADSLLIKGAQGLADKRG
ncbi:hypothetical protein [Mesorhizobium sp.]|uniref:hypothetical protein n=1 Tax=Mesorhizobium sp. TaxID=1871066 RepID=UPI0025D154C2|nr:hypothetical protein [Mesorhizobium sp.]